MATRFNRAFPESRGFRAVSRAHAAETPPDFFIFPAINSPYGPCEIASLPACYALKVASATELPTKQSIPPHQVIMQSYAASEGSNALTDQLVLIPCKEFKQKGKTRYAGVVGNVCVAPHDQYNVVYFPIDKATYAFPKENLLGWQVVNKDDQAEFNLQADSSSEEGSGTSDEDSVLNSCAELSDGDNEDADDEESDHEVSFPTRKYPNTISSYTFSNTCFHLGTLLANTWRYIHLWAIIYLRF